MRAPRCWFRDDLVDSRCCRATPGSCCELRRPMAHGSTTCASCRRPTSRLSFRPYSVSRTMALGPRVTDLLSGALAARPQRESRRGADRRRIATPWPNACRPTSTPTPMLVSCRRHLDGLQRDWARFEPERTRAALLPDGLAVEPASFAFPAKPFDASGPMSIRRAKLWNEARPAPC